MTYELHRNSLKTGKAGLELVGSGQFRNFSLRGAVAVFFIQLLGTSREENSNLIQLQSICRLVMGVR